MLNPFVQKYKKIDDMRCRPKIRQRTIFMAHIEGKAGKVGSGTGIGGGREVKRAGGGGGEGVPVRQDWT